MVKGNPIDSLEDPGIGAKIFYHDCKFGFFGFVSEVTDDLRCDSDFSAKTIDSMDQYDKERTSSNKFAMSVGANGEGSGFGISAKASASYARSTNTDEQASMSVLKHNKGEIVIAKATCLTHSVSISDYVRPVFTEDFINGLKDLNIASVSVDTATRDKAVARFIREFGTHYNKNTQLGAELIYERRFDSKHEAVEDKLKRASCVKDEAKLSVAVEVMTVAKMGANFSLSNEDCSSERKDSKTAASNGFESVRIVSRGSRPKDLNKWVDAAFTPVPIERTLMPISELFRQEWLTKSDSYGFDSDLYAAGMKDMFDASAKKYCQIMNPGKLDENCEVIGKILLKAILIIKRIKTELMQCYISHFIRLF